MIKRINLNDTVELRPQWPENPQETRSLFDGRAPLRKLVVMVDAELLDDGSPATSPAVDTRTLLAEFLNHPMIAVYRYRDEGPPPDAQPAPTGTATGDKVYDGWAVVQSYDHDSRTWRVIHRRSGENYMLSGVTGNATDVATNDTSTGAYASITEPEAASRRYADALAADVADQAIKGDVYVTEREYLHEATWLIAKRSTICSTNDALTLVGLYLRTQGEFVVLHRLHYNRGLFFLVAAREIVPSGWRWFSACLQHSRAAGDDSLILLAGSVVQRTERALQARDAIHVALNQPQNNDVREEALSRLDEVLFLLMGCLDVAARVAHRVLGLPPDEEFNSGWQKKQWLGKVRATAPGLAALVDKGTSGEQALTIIRCLRNSVHGAALQGVHVVDGREPAQTLVRLPPNDEARLLGAMDALGGRSSWGVRAQVAGRTHVDPGLVGDRLFETVMPLLNSLMEKTPVERLHGVRLVSSDLVPPNDDGPFQERARQSIRWQLGL